MSNQADQPQVWIGLAEVLHRPGAGSLMDRNSAYVNVLAMATTALDFEKLARDAFAVAGFDLVELDDAEPFAKRTADMQVDDTLFALAKSVEATGIPRFGTFHTWTSEDRMDR